VHLTDLDANIARRAMARTDPDNAGPSSPKRDWSLRKVRLRFRSCRISRSEAISDHPYRQYNYPVAAIRTGCAMDQNAGELGNSSAVIFALDFPADTPCS